MNFQA